MPMIHFISTRESEDKCLHDGDEDATPAAPVINNKASNMIKTVFFLD